MTGANRHENARVEAQLGDESLRAAEALLGLALYNDAVSRAYYAPFHYAHALLLLHGLEPKTHRGVVSLLSEHYEKPALISSADISGFVRLQAFRNVADYDARTRISAERARAEVTAARAFACAIGVNQFDRCRATAQLVSAANGVVTKTPFDDRT